MSTTGPARVSLSVDLTPDLENYTIFTYSHSDTNGTLGKMAYLQPRHCRRLDRTRALRWPRGLQTAPNSIAQTAAGYGYYDVANNNTNPFVRGETWQAINTTTWKASDTLTVKNIFSYGVAKESYSFNLEGDNIARPFVMTYPGPDTARATSGL